MFVDGLTAADGGGSIDSRCNSRNKQIDTPDIIEQRCRLFLHNFDKRKYEQLLKLASIQ